MKDRPHAVFNLGAAMLFCGLAFYIRYIHGVGTLHDFLINSGVATNEERDNLVHIFSAIGTPGILYFIMGFITSSKVCARIDSSLNNCIGAGIFYIVGAVLWEFYDSRNTANQFLYDLIGVSIYMFAAYFRNYVAIVHERIRL